MASSQNLNHFNLKDLKQILSDLGCNVFLTKPLAENDNSKNQIYLGKNFEVLNVFPNLKIIPDQENKAIFKAYFNFFWIGENGQISPAPEAKLILYPQYPEVRFSGFLKGSAAAPSDLLNKRLIGRILFLGIRPDGNIYGYVAAPSASINREYQKHIKIAKLSVFEQISLDEQKIIDTKVSILKELKRIHLKNWINSKKLNAMGHIGPCNGTNCGGLTLEAELGIKPNGFSEPDYLGWEVKQYSVTNFTSKAAKVVTLMTPEPDGGEYKEFGIEKFIREYGYEDKKGRIDRLNFGGLHVFDRIHPNTNLVLKLIGYTLKGIENPNGCIALVNNKGKIAASWSFASVMQHWNRKHSKAVYVPSICQKIPFQYRYGNIVQTGEGTDFLMLLKSIANGSMYYDPGIKLECASGSKPICKRRSQFRIKSSELGALYHSGLRTEDVLKY